MKEKKIDELFLSHNNFLDTIRAVEKIVYLFRICLQNMGSVRGEIENV
jgi:hypothetical protein